MNILFFLIGTCLLASTKAQNVEEKFFDQQLDHSTTSGTWRQRYLENRQFYKPGGPIFLYFGGPKYNPLNPTALQNGSMVTYATEQGANLIALEARYYGQSRPTPDLSQENLAKYLNIELTVADYAEFAKWLKTQSEFTNAKIVGFGAGLLGSRLVQVMKNYTNAIDIGVISSTPVEIKYEVPEYANVAVEILNRSHPECYDSVHDTLVCLERLTKGDTCQGHKRADVKDMFNLCAEGDPTNNLDASGLLLAVLKMIGGVILTNNPDPNFPYNVEKMCKALEDGSQNLTHLERVAQEFKKVQALVKLPCVEIRFEKQVETLQNPAWDTPATLSGDRQAYWLRCSQGALIRTPSAFNLTDKGQFVVTYITELCKRLFSITPEQMRINSETGNELHGRRKLQPQCGIFVTGGDDLFKGLSVSNQTEAGNCNRAILIEGASFAKNSGEIKPEGQSYPPALRSAQLQIGSVIADWLKTGNCCVPPVKRLFQNPQEIYNIYK